MNLKFMKCGLIALGCLALSFGQANADLILDASTKGTGATASHSITGAGAGTSVTATTLDSPGVDSSITVTYSVTGLDLSAEEAGATSASFDFDVTYSSGTTDAVSFSGAGNAGIDNTQVSGSEELTIAVSNLTNIMGFGGTISFDGITSARVANFNNDPDQQNLLLSDGSNIVLVGGSDTTGATPVGAAVGDSATISAGLGITEFTQSAVAGAAGFRNLGTQFTACAMPVPEPSALVMLGAIACLVTGQRRRKF